MSDHASEASVSTPTAPVHAEVKRELSSSQYRSLHLITCQTEKGVLVLRGVVATYYLKQMAQEIALKHAKGETPVQNEVQVTWK